MLLKYSPLLFLLLLCGLFTPQFAHLQPTVIQSIKIHKSMIAREPENKMIELKSICPNLLYELRYAGYNNFVGQPMYPKGTRHTFLLKAPALAIKEIQAELAKMGLGLKIWDAYRPYSVTVAFWKKIGDERYVANPAKGSGHNRGTAVDLTIVRLADDTELEMGTRFDHFGDSAHHGFTQLPEQVLQNRGLLKKTMEKHGFNAYEEEWWHYSWPNPQRYALLDVPFKKLYRLR